MKAVLFIVGVVVLAVVVGLFFQKDSSEEGSSLLLENDVVLDKKFVSDEVGLKQAESKPTEAIKRAVPPGLSEYSSDEYWFSLLYPESLSVSEISEGSEVSSIVFQNEDLGKGFQIFVIPYTKEEITDDQLKRDLPSGIIRDKEEIVVNGAKGIAFYSSDNRLGETREVWFVNDGYLFEVTTPKVLEADLLKVLETWKFIVRN